MKTKLASIPCLTEILYEAPESLVSGSSLICLTSLPSITAYSVIFGWNFGFNLPGEMESFSKSALSMLLRHDGDTISSVAGVEWGAFCTVRSCRVVLSCEHF